MIIKGYSTLHKASKLEPHHKMQFSFILLKPISGWFLPLCKGWTWCILNIINKAMLSLVLLLSLTLYPLYSKHCTYSYHVDKTAVFKYWSLYNNNNNNNNNRRSYLVIVNKKNLSNSGLCRLGWPQSENQRKQKKETNI